MIFRIAKWTLRLVLGLLLVLVVAGAGLFFWLRTSQPTIDGRIEIAGIERPVTIVRDARGIPHIRAETRRDAYFAIGWLHAQDRLFQMEMQRRIGQGRMAEIVGSAGLGIDRFTRTLGLYRQAKASVAHLEPETRAALQAYADGVNTWLRTRENPLPPEFTLLAMDFEPWTPADSLVWGKTMAIQLSGNWRNELLRMRLIEALGEKVVPVLFPPYPGDAPVTIENWETGRIDKRTLDRMWAALPHSLIGTGASNQWVVSGERTQSGTPILANDPHLGLQAPIIWYPLRVEAPGMTLAGATVPGTPALVIGHNGHIAWGVTTTYVDTDDLFIEKVAPGDPSRYMTPEGPRPFETRKEVIKVRFGDDVTLTVRETRHGPVLPDSSLRGAAKALADGHVLALRASWLTDRDTTADALMGLAFARDWQGFREAMRRYVGPLQNFVYADRAGNIGYLVPGRIPIRRKGEGYVPHPGWTGEYGWTGFVPFDELPQAYNPPSGVIVNANSKIAGKDYPHFLSHEWGDHYRAARIEALLAETEKHTPETMARIQGDVLSLMARDLLPLMGKFEPDDGEARQALDRLKAWDGTLALDRSEPLVFFAWLAELNRQLYADELGPQGERYVGLRGDVVKGILTEHTDWCDDKRTENKTETCEDILKSSLNKALADLRERHGDDPAVWRWGDAHVAIMEHPVFRMVPGLSHLTTLRIATSGGPHTVNKGGVRVGDRDAPFANRHAAGYRGIYPMADLDASRFTIATGASGNPYSPFWGNLVRSWRDLRYWTLAPESDALGANAAGTLTLVPARAAPGGQ